MEASILKKKIQEVQRKNAEYESVLNHFGILLNDLPLGMQDILDEYAELKLKTGLADLDPTYLEEWWCSRMRDIFPKKLLINQLNRDIQNLKREINDEENKIKDIQRFINNNCKNINSDQEMEQMLENKNYEKQQLIQTKNKIHFEMPFELDEVIRKVEMLEHVDN